MTWRDDLRRVTFTIDGRTRDLIGASFRGAPFFVDEAELGGIGRRTVKHEFPFRDDPFVEDMGRRARDFKVDGYVIGDDYLAAKEALITALETEGPGQLVHPYYGLRRAICDTATVRETKKEGGWARVSIAFIETPLQAPVPVIADDGASKVATAADNALLAVSSELSSKLDADGLPAFALASAEASLTNAAAAIGAKLAPAAQAAAAVAGGTADLASAVTQDIASLNGQVRILTSQAASLVRQPADLLNGFQAAIDSVGDAAEAAPGAIMDALLEAYGADLGSPAPTTTATRERELANQQALQGALRRVIAIEAARLAPLVPYASIEEATAARDRVAAVLDEQADSAGDTAYPALVALRAQVLRAVPGGRVFPRVVTVTRRVAVPSLVLAYQVYGSVDQEPDVIARNRGKVRHPGFIAGELRVLSAG